MVVGVGGDLLSAAPGSPVVVDGSAGEVFLSPAPGRIEAAMLELSDRTRRRADAIASRDRPSVTHDGHPVRVLANVSGTAELEQRAGGRRRGRRAASHRARLPRRARWPSEEDHRRALAPILGELGARVATVRVLDFGGDKTPPFLAGIQQRGIELLLEHPDAFAAQLRAIVATAGSSKLRVLLPMVATVAQSSGRARAITAAVDAVSGAGLPADRGDDRDRRAASTPSRDRGRSRLPQHRDERPHALHSPCGPVLAAGGPGPQPAGPARDRNRRRGREAGAGAARGLRGGGLGPDRLRRFSSAPASTSSASAPRAWARSGSGSAR